MSARFNPIIQNGYVVKDLDKAMHHWSGKCGVGPFFVLEHIKFGDLYFRGQRTSIDMTAAIAYWGEMQIELIYQHDDAPSIYTDFSRSKGEGLQHVGVMTDSVEKHLAELAQSGIKPTQWGATATGIQFAYLDTDLHPGGMIELVESGAAINAFFSLAREASRNWNGRDPVRRL
jgi:Glyoxalase/Bleomycin resistance protein/Dioxygenase superfamily